MQTELTIFLAAGAGILSFLSPCVLPLIPSYITFIGGTSFSELQEGTASRPRLILRTLFFILGFALVFVALGLILSGSVLAFGGTTSMINFAAGGVIMLLGLNMIFDFLKFLNYEKRMHLSKSPAGYGGAFLAGLAFGAGWSPCVGPILGGILFLAGQEGETLKAAVYLAVYSAGLGLPFLAVALFFDFFIGKLKRLNRHMGKLKAVSGAMLIFIGLLVMTGKFQQFNRIFLMAGTTLADWESSGNAGVLWIPPIAAAVVGALPILVSFARGRKAFARGKLLFFVLFAAIGLFHAFGILNLPLVLSRWLLYQGL